ncbi:MAG: hypothetical protein MJ240_01200 [Kiritimatiellae bacterium]|nr:hypothetical protein [Kiritimatiellia bacterium]
MSDNETEPVKIKMTLHRAQPSIQGAAEVRPAAAAAIEAVEARWRAEDAKMQSERARSALKGFLSWCFILLVVLGSVWFFFGESYLPARYAYPNVKRNVLALWEQWFGEPQSPQVEPKKDPVDVATAAQRRSLKAAADLLEKVCTAEPPLQDDYDLNKRVVGTDMPDLFREIVNADAFYKKAVKLLADMKKSNEKQMRLAKLGPTLNVRGRVDLKSNDELAHQEERIIQNKEACATRRIRTVERLQDTVQKQSVRWTGPESKKDAVTLQDKLARMLHKYKLMEVPWGSTGR